MATRFEIVLYGDNPAHLRAAGEEALVEIERLEDQLSLYRPSSEIAHVNGRAAREPVRVSPSLFALLQQAQSLYGETGGAFDITIAPLVRCWGFMGGSGRLPTAEEIAEARAKVGMHLMELDPTAMTVRFAVEGVMLDLGAIGKGYAIERSAQLLREAGIANALLHGGTSSVYALGHPPGAEVWQIAIEDPRLKLNRSLAPLLTHSTAAETFSSLSEPLSKPLSESHHFTDPRITSSVDASGSRSTNPPLHSNYPHTLTIISLKDEALSVSSPSEKFFEANDKTLGHVLNPRTGEPAAGALLAAVVLPSATETDAFSTALLTLGAASHESIARLRPAMRTLLLTDSGEIETQPGGARFGDVGQRSQTRPTDL